MTNPHEPVTPNTDGTLRFSDGSELKLTERDRPQDWTEEFRRTAENEYKNSVDYQRRLMANQCTECGWTHGAHAETCSHQHDADPPKCPWCGDVGCELHDIREAWRLGHDNNCNVRVAFPSTEEDCNCHSPAAPNEIERQMSEEPDPKYYAWMSHQFSQGLTEVDEPTADQLEEPVEASEPHGLPEYLKDLKAKLAAERRKVQHLQDTLRSTELPEPKPPRIRTLELPGEINPNTHELSVVFAIVLDRMGDTTVDADQLDRLADETGARTAVSFPFEIQIGED